MAINKLIFINSDPVKIKGAYAMKNLQKFLLANVIALFGGLAFAGGNSQWASVVQVNVSNNILVKTDESFQFDPDTCNGGLAPDFYAIPASNASQNKILATTLTAKADSSKQVRFWISGCVGTRPQAVSVQLK